MLIAVVESPYKASTEFNLALNLAYGRALVEYCVRKGWAPVASHLLITQSLDDRDPADRAAGIEAGLALLRVADKHVFGVDLGISAGMQIGMDRSPLSVERVSLPEWRGLFPTLPAEEQQVRALVERYAPKWHVHESPSR